MKMELLILIMKLLLILIMILKKVIKGKKMKKMIIQN